ncbi:MAG: choloylglycine hydrolase [Eubacterium sp. 36_13]|nr:MAG: choloylglycine hydrolase [Eubacterium sp. 36_13]
MCTAATYKTKDFYMGRTLDYEFAYGEEVTVMPRNYPLHFRYMGDMSEHFAIIGMAHVADNYPLYYDAVNEKGLGMAGLNFVGNAVYAEPDTEADEKENVSQYEFIPWVLSQCSSVKEVRSLLMRINLVGTPYSEMFPAAQLHWIIADENEAITVESVKDGLKVYDNPVGVLTNNPPFDIQMLILADYAGLSPKQPVNTFASGVDLNMYSRGMGTMGLPGDLSSRSRFARVAYTKMNSRSGDSENESVSQFFHILGSVEQQRGCCEVADGKYEITIYTSCWNAAKGIYYYTTYENSQITAVDMNREELESSGLKRYPLVNGQHINYQN